MILGILGQCKADAVIIKYFEKLSSRDAENKKLLTIPDYKYSEVEKKRRLYLKIPPIDELSDKDFRDMVIDIVKFAKWIRFYDKQLGKGERISEWRRGIDYIIKCWQENGYFAADSSASVEIYTCLKKSIKENDTDHIKKSNEDINSRVIKKIEIDFIEPLRREHAKELIYISKMIKIINFMPAIFNQIRHNSF